MAVDGDEEDGELCDSLDVLSRLLARIVDGDRESCLKSRTGD